MNYLYYIHENVVSGEFPKKEPRTRIFAIPLELCSMKLTYGEGPYTSLRNLKRNSRLYKELAKKSSRLVNQMLEDKNILKIKDFVFMDKSKSYPMEFISLVEHTIKGQIQNKNVYGIHYFDPSRMRIREIVKSENKVGVWIATIDLFDEKKQQYVPKRQQTSFFPVGWSLHQLFHECFFAFTNKIKDNTKIHTYFSKTQSGVPVEIIIKDNKLKSIYPIY